MIYDHFVDKKPSNFKLALVSEQHNYDTRSASLQHLNPSGFRINIRKFCPTGIGCYYWNVIPYLNVRRQLKIVLKSTFQLFSCSVSIIATPTLKCYIFFMCVYMCFSFFVSFVYFSYIFHSLQSLYFSLFFSFNQNKTVI